MDDTHLCEAVFFFPFAAGPATGAGPPLSESSSSSIRSSEALSSALSSLFASIFFFGAAFGFGVALVTLEVGFSAVFLPGALV